MRVLVWLLLSLLTAASAGRADAWVLPLTDGTVVADFRAPAHDYAPGHRGIDVAASGDLAVRAPTDGTVAFAGRIAGRGIVTIATSGDLVITLEPVEDPPPVGTNVTRGAVVGVLGLGGHSAAGTLHVGLRRAGVYLDPAPWFRQRLRAVLLPCCEPHQRAPGP